MTPIDSHRNYTQFDPRAYLDEYYAEVYPENAALLRFLVRAFADVPAQSRTLDFGCGPTLYNAIVAAGRVESIALCEYLDANRDELQRWFDADPTAFDWREHIRLVLEDEGNQADLEAIALREQRIRQRVKKLMFCDARLSAPLGEHTPDISYDVIVTALCLEAVATTHAEWEQTVRNLTTLLKSGGKLIMAAVKQGDAYRVGDNVFAVLPIDENDLQKTLGAVGYAPDSLQIEWVKATHPIHPYEGLMLVTAQLS